MIRSVRPLLFFIRLIFFLPSLISLNLILKKEIGITKCRSNSIYKPRRYKEILIHNDFKNESLLVNYNLKDQIPKVFELYGKKPISRAIKKFIDNGDLLISPKVTKALSDHTLYNNRRYHNKAFNTYLVDNFLIKSSSSRTKFLPITHFSINHKNDTSFHYSNFSDFIKNEALILRLDMISSKLRHLAKSNSTLWHQWLNEATKSNSTTLFHIFQYYNNSFLPHLFNRDQYIPERGYSGTLAPGENFRELYPIDKLSKFILHPWPAFQEFPLSVRYPVPHPSIFHPVLWVAKNNLFTNSFQRVFNTSNENYILGGIFLRPQDAYLIARYGYKGSSFDIKDQAFEHGGLINNRSYKIPFYDSAHGPTNNIYSVPNLPLKLAEVLDYKLPKQAFHSQFTRDSNYDIEKEKNIRATTLNFLLKDLTISENITYKPIYQKRLKHYFDTLKNNLKSLKTKFSYPINLLDRFEQLFEGKNQSSFFQKEAIEFSDFRQVNILNNESWFLNQSENTLIDHVIEEKEFEERLLQQSPRSLSKFMKYVIRSFNDSLEISKRINHPFDYDTRRNFKLQEFGSKKMKKKLEPPSKNST